MLEIFWQTIRSKSANINLVVFKQHVHVLSYACFFKRTLLCYLLNLFIATVLGGMDVYVWVCVCVCVCVQYT